MGAERWTEGQPRRTVTVIVPIYNEANNVPALWDALDAAAQASAGVDFEFVFVNDGSVDDSIAALEALSVREPRAKVVDLSRNFGKEVALTAGLDSASGDAVIFIDADLQHPPALIPEMIDAWHAGAEVVVTVRRSTERESLGRRLGSKAFHWIMKNFSDVDHLAGTTDFRLLDAKVAAAVRSIGERERLFRGLIDWLGFRRVVLEFDAPSREAGQTTKFSLFTLIRLAVSSFVSHSLLPLVVLGLAGIAITVSAGLLLTWMFVAEHLVDERFYYTPLAQVVVANTLLIGLVISALGVMSLYLAKIYREVLKRPLYAVRKRWNFDEDR
ncbi:MAG: glycosyltransferase family 2 protein [Myxococcota bacterium]